MKAVNRLLAVSYLASLSGVGLGCGFPSDWDFKPTGGSGGSQGGSAGAASGAAGAGASGGNPAGGSSQGGTSAGGSDTGGSGRCASGTGDCDMDAGNGCETNLKTVTDCGACGVPCNLANAVDPCATGTCTLGMCITPFDNCDAVAPNGCETNLLTDSMNCGMCGKMCDATKPSCVNGVCMAGCSPDSFEPNELVQAPAALPMLGTMRKLDDADNDFKVSAERTDSVTATFTNDGDVDTFYLHVTDDAPLPAGKTKKAAGFDITLSGIPNGAKYSIDGFWTCEDGTSGVNVFNPDPPPCPVDGANTDFVGQRWWHCLQEAPAPIKTYTYGHGCESSGDATGVLQLQLKVIDPPSSQTCSEYTLTVHVFQIAI
jgi:hypothetical protein